MPGYGETDEIQDLKRERDAALVEIGRLTAMPLLQLPTGEWVDPQIIQSITPLERSEDYPGIGDRVQVWCKGDRVFIIHADTPRQAQEIADEIGAAVNRTRGHGTKGTTNE